MTLFTEFPAFAPGLTPLITLGSTQANGMRHGFALPTDRPMNELVPFVNDRPDLGAAVGHDWWARYHAARIDAVGGGKGPVGIDLSGHCFARCVQDELSLLVDDKGKVLAQAGDAGLFEFTIEAIKRTLQQVDRTFKPEDLFFADVEPWVPDGGPEWGGKAIAAKAKFFRKLWESGITGEAMIVTPWVAAGRKANGKVPLTPGSCDERTGHVPGYFNLFAAADEHLDWLAGFLEDLNGCGLTAVLHCTGAMFDEHNRPYSTEKRSLWKRQMRLCMDKGVKTAIVYNIGGQGPATLMTDLDLVARQADDSATAAWEQD